MDEGEYKAHEEKVTDRPGSYRGLSQDALLTSREDYLEIFSALPEIRKWVEPGSGYGLGPRLFGEIHPEKTALGIEFESARYEASEKSRQELKLTNVSFSHADLLKSPLPRSDAYFFYFPTGMVLDKLLSEIGVMSQPLKIIAIESHGDLIPRLEKEHWLKEIKRIPLKSQRHNPYAFVFEKSGTIKPSLHAVSFRQMILTIREDNGEKWLGESYGLEWSRNDEFILHTPPRTIREKQVEEIVSLSTLDQQIQWAIELRKLGILRVEAQETSYQGEIRKIFFSPSFKVEISTGQQVEWRDIKKIYWETTLCYDASSAYFYLPHAV